MKKKQNIRETVKPNINQNTSATLAITDNASLSPGKQEGTSVVESVSSIVEPQKNWAIVGECVVGMAHRRMSPPIVCQDAYYTTAKPRSVVVVCDGAGSSVASEIGSRSLSIGVVRLIKSLNSPISSLLDRAENVFTDVDLAHTIHEYSTQLISDLAQENKRESRDFRTTMLVFIVGIKRSFWLRVGDGEIVGEVDGKLVRIGDSNKGEFSNQTVFVDDKLPFTEIRYGLIDSKSLTGAAVMTDGASEKLVSIDGRSITTRLSTYFESLRNDKLPREELYKFLNDYEVWKQTTHDDKTLVIMAR